MDLIKQYISQSIAAASNNLRLNNQQIEVVALLKETILNSEDVHEDLKNMKKITELSTLAIKLNEIYSYLTQRQVDLFKLSDKFREHSQLLIKDLNRTLEMVNPDTFRIASRKLYEARSKNDIKIESVKNKEDELNYELGKKKEEKIKGIKNPIINESTNIKERLIFDEEKTEEEISFQNYESEILKPIKPIDSMLKEIINNEVDADELNKFATLMKKNGEISDKIGFEIIANMHSIIARALQLIKTRELMPGKEIVESIRACLIVIVAVVKGKEVDITGYLNKAEEFGRKLHLIKVKD